VFKLILPSYDWREWPLCLLLNHNPLFFASKKPSSYCWATASLLFASPFAFEETIVEIYPGGVLVKKVGNKD